MYQCRHLLRTLTENNPLLYLDAERNLLYKRSYARTASPYSSNWLQPDERYEKSRLWRKQQKHSFISYKKDEFSDHICNKKPSTTTLYILGLWMKMSK